jgi:hypothetical protein
MTKRRPLYKHEHSHSRSRDKVGLPFLVLEYLVRAPFVSEETDVNLRAVGRNDLAVATRAHTLVEDIR